ncbi:MAG: AMP-binding protein, partial [Dehalococcoidia bacterium]
MRIHDFLDYQAREHPDIPFAIQADRCVTYREAQAEANRLANALVDGGLQNGNRIAILAKNSIEYVLLYFAASKAGVAPVPLNTRLAPTEWAYIIHDAEARALFAGPEFVAAIEGIRAELATVKQFIALDAAPAADWEEYRTWATASSTTAPPECTITEEDDCYQMYTSGTTGRPKGAVLTHRAVGVY